MNLSAMFLIGHCFSILAPSAILTYLAVFGGGGFAGVPAGEAVDTVLEFPAHQGSILPAALRVRETHPLAQVLWLVGCGLVR